MSKTVEFVVEGDRLTELFKELEEVIRNKCNTVGIDTDGAKIDGLIRSLSEKNRIVKKYKTELLAIKDIRNINTHNRSDNYKYVVCPNPEINERLKEIIEEIKNPPKIINMCIKRSEMYCKTLNDTVIDTIRDMTMKLYTHIPIIENHILVGVFSENTLLDIVNRDEGIIVDKNMIFSDISEGLKVENHSMENFVFISKHQTIYDVEDLFKNYFKDNKRIGCVYVTEHGKKDEEILGMLTAWDVLGH